MGTFLVAGLIVAGSIAPAAPVTSRESLTASAIRLARDIAAEPPAAPQSRKGDWGNVRDLDTGSRVRVTLRSGIFKEGTLAEVDDDRIVVSSSANGRIVVARTDVAEVSKPMRRSLVGGVLGTAVGGVLGVGSAVTLAFKQCGGSCNDEKLLLWGSLIALPIAGGYGGARLGAVGRWTTVYRG